MFKRVGEYLTFVVKDLKALEEVSKYICVIIERPYFIEVETFPSTQVYHVSIKCDEIKEQSVRKGLKGFADLAKFEILTNMYGEDD